MYDKEGRNWCKIPCNQWMKMLSVWKLEKQALKKGAREKLMSWNFFCLLQQLKLQTFNSSSSFLEVFHNIPIFFSYYFKYHTSSNPVLSVWASPSQFLLYNKPLLETIKLGSPSQKSNRRPSGYWASANSTTPLEAEN